MPSEYQSRKKLIWPRNDVYKREIQMSLKIAVIGSGYMAEQHIIALQTNTQCEIVGITSRNDTTARNLAHRYGIQRIEKKYS